MKVLAIGHTTGKDIRLHLEAEGRNVAELRAQGVVRDVFLTRPVLVRRHPQDWLTPDS